MNNTKNKKGFTLVELLVVIAIIAIMAAILIPAIGGYITQAHRGRDVELAGYMSDNIGLYTTEHNIPTENLTGSDVRTILLLNDYELKTRNNAWVFVYDRNEKRVKVMDLVDGNIQTSGIPENPIDPTHFDDRYFLISKGSNKLEKAVDYLLNLGLYENDDKKNQDYEKAVAAVSKTAYEAHIEKFDPSTTLYLSNSGYYTQNESEPIYQIVISDLTTHLTKLNSAVNVHAQFTTRFNTVRTSEQGAELKIFFNGVKDVDYKKLMKIDLTNGSIGSGGSFYKITLGSYFKQSKAQSITDELVHVMGLDYKEVVTGSNNKLPEKLYITRKVVVKLYNEEGIFAYGEMTYAIQQKNPNFK